MTIRTRIGGVVGFLFVLVNLISCAQGVDPTGVQPPEMHADESDFLPVYIEDGKGDIISPVFNRHNILSDEYFLDVHAINGDAAQLLLENTHYGRSSWLAFEVVNGKRAADIIVEAGHRNGINPMLLLTRMQVEQGAVSKSQRPSDYKVNRIMGCGCFDGQSCINGFLGFENQVNCAAETLRERFDGSMEQTWSWQKGVARDTLDPLRVVPENHATAALYAYTPWVLQGSGGNWLVWNVTLRFTEHLRKLEEQLRDETAFVGTPCTDSTDCVFAEEFGQGFCAKYTVDGHNYGYCTMSCISDCPSRVGYAETYCVEPHNEWVYGFCMPRSTATNNYCEDLPGMREVDLLDWAYAPIIPQEASVCMFEL